ncbi:MAG: radical SAM protein [Pseudomonadota bacterium]|jgi:wyosine [tRNA(Phe)-imidazoG37] synthetase (radical SAM superfamily)
MQRKEKLSTTDHSRDSAGMRYVYPVISRRAGGVSIGINLNPNNACNWQCIYCQVPGLTRGAAPAIDLALLERELRTFLEELLHGDFMQRQVPEDARRIADVAFSGNGEPTGAKEFPEIVSLVGRLVAEQGLPGRIPLRLITNGSLVGQAPVREGLRRLAHLGGEVWFKVDAGTSEKIRLINGANLSPRTIAKNLRRCTELCPTWVQTCMFALDGQEPTSEDIEAYLEVLRECGPERLLGVHLYSLARPPMQAEAGRLSRLDETALERIASRIRAQGLTVTVSP